MKRGLILFVLFACMAGLLSACGGGGGKNSGPDPLTNWHLRDPLPDGNVLNAVTYANCTFVAVGEGGTILTSPDGATWTVRSSGTSHSLGGVTYGNKTFVAVGDSGTILQSDPVE